MKICIIETIFDRKFIKWEKQNRFYTTIKGSGNKPYYYNLKYNDNNILIPFRSNSERISTKYKLETNHIQTDRKNLLLIVVKF